MPEEQTGETQETEQTQDTSTESQGTGETTEEAQTEEEQERGFNKTELQQLGSMMGRLIKRQIQEDVLPIIQNQNDPVKTFTRQNETQSALDKFNEQLQEKILSGDVLGALQMANQVQESAKATLAKNAKQATDKALTALSEQPYYKDIHSDMSKLAHEMVKKGYSPEEAVDYAYHRAKGEFLEKTKGKPADEDTGGLDMATGGKTQQKAKTPKLPPQFEAAYQRDQKKNLWKDRAEYIANLSSQIKAQYGIGI